MESDQTAAAQDAGVEVPGIRKAGEAEMMNIEYGPRGREILSRFYPDHTKQWVLALSPGPHLFTDWRHILVAEIRGGFHWASKDTGEKIPLEVRDEKGEYSSEPVDAVMVPYDVPEGIRISVCNAERSDPVPLEEPPGQVMFSEGSYRTWYSPHPGWKSRSKKLEGGMFHAESDDGFTWKKRQECTIDWTDCPEVEVITFPGIFQDPAAEKEERFKFVFQGGSTKPEFAEHRQKVLEEFLKNHKDDLDPVGLSLDAPQNIPTTGYGRYGAVSPDGFHWKVLRLPLMIIRSDAQNVVYYDTNRESYIWYLKTRWYDGRRSIGRAETKDFRDWPIAETVVYPGPDLLPSDDWYTNSKTLYPGTTDHHFLFPGLYHHADDTSEIRAFTSVDTTHWNQIPGGSILSPADSRSWDAGFKTAGIDLVPLPGDRVGLPYHGSQYPHKYPRNKHTMATMAKAYALWPRERIAALTADESGRFTTLPLLSPGRKLRLNYKTGQSGEIRVEAAESLEYGGAKEPLPGRSFSDCLPLVGDEMDRIVTWKTGQDLGNPEGRPVTLRFRMRSASLFAFEII